MNAGDWIQIAVTIMLAGITGWYAWETRRIVRNMEKDREEMHRPVLAFELISWDASLLKLRIQNVGSGVAVDVRGTIESTTKSGSASFPWSYPLLCAGQYEEFGFPTPQGASNEDRFRFEKIRENVVEVQAKFKYRSTRGVDYQLNDSIPVQKVTNDWVTSRMLVTQDHPDRIMPRIAKTLEGIEKELEKLHN